MGGRKNFVGSACADTADQAPCTTRSNRINSKADLSFLKRRGDVINKLCDNSCSIHPSFCQADVWPPFISSCARDGKDTSCEWVVLALPFFVLACLCSLPALLLAYDGSFLVASQMIGLDNEFILSSCKISLTSLGR